MRCSAIYQTSDSANADGTVPGPRPERWREQPLKTGATVVTTPACVQFGAVGNKARMDIDLSARVARKEAIIFTELDDTAAIMDVEEGR